jgi:hypothetical protein
VRPPGYIKTKNAFRQQKNAGLCRVQAMLDFILSSVYGHYTMPGVEKKKGLRRATAEDETSRFRLETFTITGGYPSGF